MSHKLSFTKEFLISEYLDKRKSSQQIASEIKCNPSTIRNHLSSYNIPIRTAAEASSKYTCKNDYFTTFTPAMAYILGFITADGCIHNDRYLSITINQKDKSVLEFIKLEIEYTGQIHDYDSHIANIYSRIYITSSQICNDLSKFGVVPRKTGKEWLPNIPNEYKYAYLLGLFDGDGCFHFGPHSKTRANEMGYAFMLVSASRSFLEDIRETILDNHGCIVKKGKANCFQLHISSPKFIMEIYSKMYNQTPFCLQRKKEKFEEMIEYRKNKFGDETIDLKKIGKKRCGKCKQIKDKHEFSLSRTANSGLQSCCKLCQKTYYEKIF